MRPRRHGGSPAPRLHLPLASLTATLGIGLMGALPGCHRSTGFGSDFEGTITMTTTRHGADPAPMSVEVKGDKMRIDIKGPDGKPASALYLPPANKLVVLLDSQKAAMDMDMAAPSAPQPNTNAQTSAVDKTGKKETIAGIECEDWVVKDPRGSRTETCVAPGVAYLDLDSLRHGGGAAWKADMRANKTFPLRSVEISKDGTEVSRTEVTNVKKEKLDDARFVVPADYKRLPVPQR